jgi:hypothetical protein
VEMTPPKSHSTARIGELMGAILALADAGPHSGC